MSAESFAHAIRSHSHRQARQAGYRVQHGDVVSDNPIQIELHESDITLHEAELNFSQSVDRYHTDDRIKTGDVVTVSHVMDEWWLLAVFSDHKPTRHSKTAVGAVHDFAGSGDPNPNWMLADGRAISRADHPELFSTIGTGYGSGDGSTTFNIPDLRPFTTLRRIVRVR